MSSSVHPFVFNIVSENTYLLIDQATKQTAIVDCGCMNPQEEKQLKQFIEKNQLQPSLLLFTHLHFDHTWGLNFAIKEYDLIPMAHPAEIANTPPRKKQFKSFAMCPSSDLFEEPLYQELQEGQELHLGQTTLKVLFVPGHSAGHVAFYSPQDHYVLTGDALFAGDIGRTDLWGGDYDTLIRSLKTQLMILPGQTSVYPGHGPASTIDREKNHNPYVQ